MALVIGTRIRRADRASARAAIGGITALNDVSARKAQRSSGGQYVRGKSFDTFAPLGPCITDASGLDPNNLAVRLTLSGEQHAGLEHVGHDLRRRGPDRLRLRGHDARAGRRDRHRHAERRRHGTRPAALAASTATSARSRSRASACCATRSSPRLISRPSARPWHECRAPAAGRCTARPAHALVRAALAGTERSGGAQHEVAPSRRKMVDRRSGRCRARADGDRARSRRPGRRRCGQVR